MIVSASLAVIALLAFALSFVAFLVQSLRHRSSRGWAAAAGASLILVILLGGLANALIPYRGTLRKESRLWTRLRL